jgi:cyclopropane-fatty-acyl-phospholipid synthase
VISSPVGLSKWIVTRTLEHLAEGSLEVTCRDGVRSFGAAGSAASARISVRDERVFPRVLAGSDIGLGESYVDGDWSSPDLVGFLRLAIRNLALFENRHRLLTGLGRWRDLLQHRRRANTRAGSRANIHAHYDIGNEFYRLFLDPSMAYSCGVYRSAADTLEQAQFEKFDRICRKLRLGPSDHVLEIGTGWGGFAVHAATHYGCRVTTTTISAEQYAGAAALFARMELGPDRVRLLQEDYRDLRGRYDKLVSIEMFEAVGHEHYDTFFEQCDRLLASDGAMALQTITVPDARFRRYLATPDWIQKYIFPGGELASVSAILESLARTTRLGLHHAEDIGAHYAHTLRAWRQRFLGRLDEVRALGFDDRFIRTWDYYLASCEAAFAERLVGNVQLVLSKAMNRRALLGEPWEEASDVGTARWRVARRLAAVS